MKLSIIIPVYKTQDTLDRCLKSILQQSFTDYEIILVDDGSPDDCPLLCDNYAHKYSNIQVIHQPNGGLSDARNTGINQAQGEYITFIDSDDTLKDDTLPLLMAELYQHPDVDILEYPVWERYGHPSKQKQLTFTPREYTSPTVYWLQERAYNHTYAWNKIYKRHLFAHIRFPKGCTFEDVLTTPYLTGLQPLHNGESIKPKIRVTDKGCYVYHWNQRGITATAQYQDLYNLYQGHTASLEQIFRQTGIQPEILITYQDSLQHFILQILNVLLDLYELSGKYEVCPPIADYVGKLSKIMKIKPFKLKVLNILGYHTLCRINKLIHRIYRNH